MTEKIKRYLSHSGAKDYLSCPHKFAHRRIWHTEVPEVPTPDYIHTGNAFHGWLQKEEYMDDDTLVKEAGADSLAIIKHLKQYWKDHPESAELFNKATALQHNEVEFLYTSDAKTTIRGFIDIVGFDFKGNITIIEIKTGKKPYPSKYKSQLRLYTAVFCDMVTRNRKSPPKILDTPGHLNYQNYPVQSMLICAKTTPPYTIKIHNFHQLIQPSRGPHIS